MVAKEDTIVHQELERMHSARPVMVKADGVGHSPYESPPDEVAPPSAQAAQLGPVSDRFVDRDALQVTSSVAHSVAVVDKSTGREAEAVWNMRILVIEDETKTGEYLLNGLTEAGYIVDVAGNGIDGLHLAQEMHYDLILLDVMMPAMDGWTVMKRLGARVNTPVLFLSARGTLEDRLKGLDLGADDYLVKPFSFAELLARIRIILRRGQPQKQEEEALAIGDLCIDVSKRRVERGGVRIALTNKEFNLLLFFAQHQGQVLSRALIASRVWDMNFDSDSNVVDVAVRRLRQKIDDPFAVRVIHTVHGVGYRCEHET